MSREPYVIVGAGHAARRAAETLRALNEDARVVMIGAEPELPYDRPVLSKDALTSEAGEQRAFIRDRAWYDAQRIELRLGVAVEAIDRPARTVQLADGSRLAYERLLIATGSRVRRFPGVDETRVPLHYVRTVADARALRAVLLPGKRVAVIGGGFIGLEVAASAATLGCSVTLIEPAEALLQRSMPAAVGEFILSLHAGHGVDVRLGTAVQGIHRSEAQNEALNETIVETSRGAIVADVVVIGIGVVPNVELAQQSGLEVDNGIVVDAACRTSDPAIFAAGEVTRHFNPLLGCHLRVESWQVAENQPAIAAANMLDDEAAQTYAEIPWLWSDQYDCNLQTLGLFDPQQTLVTRRSADNRSLTLLALGAGGKIEAVAAVNAGRDIGACRRLMASGKIVEPGALGDPAIALRTFI
ncbi:anthranilate 1,2-dioxygenase system ferredoxin--NAD(+) reductase [Paraburkholderia sp. BCC1886]|uniref:anthranilate 1,2-dioxygenase system ferredoxin--NAD(+) reductase n=1 Tax=Paraburkholderia sp. BCC1886 TaxID=2562670 RepID=UPI001183E61B|nr:anthranilate 1,2-dioxygenase system ferredoxin--NAD(+) reductase [Paraburkholderia sp. BCC1886]